MWTAPTPRSAASAATPTIARRRRFRGVAGTAEEISHTRKPRARTAPSALSLRLSAAQAGLPGPLPPPRRRPQIELDPPLPDHPLARGVRHPDVAAVETHGDALELPCRHAGADGAVQVREPAVLLDAIAQRRDGLEGEVGARFEAAHGQAEAV